MNDEYYHMTWDEYDLIIYKLLEDIKKSGKKYEVIGTFPLNGYIPAITLAKKLGIKYVFNMRSFTQLEINQMEDVLIVDDITDSGTSLQRVRMHDIACLCYKKCSDIRPTYFSIEIEEETWVIFPWEKK